MGISPAKEANLKRRGLESLRQNRLVEARDIFKDACERGSKDAEIWYHLAIINGRLGSLEGVEPCLRQAVKLAPGFSEAALRLGEALGYLGKLPESIEVLRQLVTRSPGLVEAWMKLGNTLEASGSHQEAIECYRKAAQLNPQYDVAYTSLGNAAYFIGEYAMAMQAYKRAADINPGSLKAHLGKYLSLPVIYESKTQMLEARARFVEGIDRLTAQAELFKRSPTLIDELQWSYNFYLAYQGLDDTPAQAAYGRFFTDMVGHALPQFMQAIPKRSISGRRIRVGYVAHFFHSHTVSIYFNNWILNAARDRFETFVYHVNPIFDPVSRRLAEGCTQYRPLAGPIAGMAQAIRNDMPDILVYPEVGMFSKVQWLAALRLAPIQCAAWGHPVTTGLPNIDYALSAEATEPENAEPHYTETLVRLSGIGACLDTPSDIGPSARAQFGLPEDRHLYLCPQSLFKIHVDMDDIMVALASRDPDALILLFDDYKPAVNTAYRQRIHTAFTAAGLEPERHLHFLPRMTPQDFLRVNRVSDVMIDTPHWSGGRTSLDALSVGLPIVTLPGQFSRGRQTFGMLIAIGLPQLVAEDIDDYVAKAISIASNPEERRHFSDEISARAPDTLFNNLAPLRDLERHFQSWLE